MSETFDVVIAGGAVIGSSIACHLAMRQPGLKVLVVEPDPTYQRSASALSAGSIRQQFSSAVNIDISLHGIDFLRRVEEHLGVDGEPVDIGLKEIGYLYIATEPARRCSQSSTRCRTGAGRTSSSSTALAFLNVSRGCRTRTSPRAAGAAPAKAASTAMA